MVTTLLLSALFIETVPFGTSITLPPSSVRSYQVSVVNTNKFGPWSTSTSFPTDGTIQYIPLGSAGWHGATLWTDSNGSLVRTSLDGSKSQLDGVLLASPGGLYRSMPGRAMGAWQGWVWPKEYALQIKASNCTIAVRSKDSPSMGLEVIGDNNKITLDVEQGQQSNNIQDLAAVRIVGKGNTIAGVVKGQMCALFINGPNNILVDLSLSVEGYGDDCGVLYLKASASNTRATNLSLWMPKAQYPSSHGRNGAFIDDKASNCLFTNVSVYGAFDNAIKVHGGNGNKVDGLKVFGSTTPFLVVPHIYTPAISPTGNQASRVTVVQ